MQNHMDTYAVGDAVEWDTFEGIRRGIVTAVGASWAEVDGHLHSFEAAPLCFAEVKPLEQVLREHLAAMKKAI